MNRQFTMLFLSLFYLLYWEIVSQLGKLPVFVSIVPQKYFVQQIGKDLVDVQVMVLPGASPATYEPKPNRWPIFQIPNIYFAIGVPFEERLAGKIADANPNMRVIHTDHGIEKLAMAAHHHHDDQAEEHHEGEHHEAIKVMKKVNTRGAAHDEDHHEHAGLDPHIWLSPPLVKIQARTILAALQEADPAHQCL
jgi:zinc transport system substrate-binding protein